jgi:hypothetical protein
VTTIITNHKQADTVTRQLEHVRSQVQRGDAELELIRNQITAAIMGQKSTVDLLSKRSRIDSGLQAHRQSERDITAALEAWDAAQGRQRAQAARHRLEQVTAEAREMERQGSEVVAVLHGILDRIDEMAREHNLALHEAKGAGALGDEYGAGQPIFPSPSYPDCYRETPKPAREKEPSNLPKRTFDPSEWSFAPISMQADSAVKVVMP